MFKEYSRLFPKFTGFIVMLLGALTLCIEYYFIKMICDPKTFMCVCLVLALMVSIINKVIVSIHAAKTYSKLPKTVEEIKDAYANVHEALVDIIDKALVRWPMCCERLQLFCFQIFPLYAIYYGFKMIADDFLCADITDSCSDTRYSILSTEYYCPDNVFVGTVGVTIKAVNDAFNVYISTAVLRDILTTGKPDILPLELVERKWPIRS